MSPQPTDIPKFVKKFDFRGVYNKDITDKDAYYLGHALYRTLSLKKVLIGWDTRTASRSLAFSCMTALRVRGVSIEYLEACPIDYVTVGSFAFDYDLSIMFTGSHNTWEWSGLLMHTKNGDSVQGALVKEIIKHYHESLGEPFHEAEIRLDEFTNALENVESVYAEKIKSLLPLESIKPLSVAVDIGDGSGTKSMRLLEKLLPQVTFTLMNTRDVYDADSPHVADPSGEKNLEPVRKKVLDERLDGGFAFDSDADRVLGVDESGSYLNGSVLGSGILEALLSAGTLDQNIGYAVDCGVSFHNAVTRLNNETNRSLNSLCLPVGRSILRQMVRDGSVDFAIENVGHFYLKDFFMTDSGTFSLAILLLWMSENGPLSGLRSRYPDGERDQIFIPVEDIAEGMDQNIEEALRQLPGGTDLRKIDVDGVRYELYNGEWLESWFATRKSGYEPIQKYFFGSLDQGLFAKLRAIVTNELKNTRESN